MSDPRAERTQRTANLYFKDVADEKPYELWRAFDPEMAKALSLFITGDLYAREKLPHTVRQLVTVGVLTVLNRPEELRLHIQAALNVGCRPEEIAEAIFQTFTYGGVPTVNTALKVFRQILIDRDEWPLKTIGE
ncbi:MAG: carboxymuconolactone decarboxylase family protein [Desulfosarcinaceae bacterium]|jgi:4-carboxymuconolactone decarboxylase